jgi:hypothetical protein
MFPEIKQILLVEYLLLYTDFVALDCSSLPGIVFLKFSAMTQLDEFLDIDIGVPLSFCRY